MDVKQMVKENTNVQQVIETIRKDIADKHERLVDTTLEYYDVGIASERGKVLLNRMSKYNNEIETTIQILVKLGVTK